MKDLAGMVVLTGNGYFALMVSTPLTLSPRRLYLLSHWAMPSRMSRETFMSMLWLLATHNYDGPFTLNIECSDGIMGLHNYTLLYREANQQPTSPCRPLLIPSVLVFATMVCSTE